MNTSKITWELRDNGGRRSGIDRRYFSYSDHIPERRQKEDRRSHEDRRSGSERRLSESPMVDLKDEKRSGSDRRSAWT